LVPLGVTALFGFEKPPPPPPPPPPQYSVVLIALAVVAFMIALLACVAAMCVWHKLSGSSPGRKKTRSDQNLARLARPLVSNKETFSKCVLPGGDIDVYAYERGCRNFADHVMEGMCIGGRLMAVTTHANVEKLRESLANYELTTGMPAGRSLRALYHWEAKQKMHEPGGVIADPSAAMGVLWCRHGLQTWINFFELSMAHADPQDCGVLMEEAIEASHGELVGWWSRQTVALACKTMGPWEELAQTVGPSRADTELDAKAWCRVVTEVIVALKALQKECDYEDQRCSS